MPAMQRTAVLLGICISLSMMPNIRAQGFPALPESDPGIGVLHKVHGFHCGRRYSSSRGWHRHADACRDLGHRSAGWGWCWQDAAGNQLCFGDIRRRNPEECRSNPYALGCRTERWDNR